MIYNEEFNFSTEELNFLRENTSLDIISKFKLHLLGKKMNYSDLNLYEYNLRVKAWLNYCKPYWIDFLNAGNGCNLKAFARKKLDDSMDINMDIVKIRTK